MTDSKNDLPFSDILQKGLGRAFNYITLGEPEETRSCLLNACIHDLAYDPQCESGRADWLFELISLTDDVEFYRQNILQALSVSTNFWDTNQLDDLAAIWAKQSCLEAKKAIYQTFMKQANNESWLGGKQIISIDGIKGLLAVAEIIGMKLLEDSELYEDDYLISEASINLGASNVIDTLEKESINNVKIKAYLDAVRSYQANLENNGTKTKKTILKVDDAIQLIEKGQNCFYILYRFGRYAEEKEIEQIFERVLAETRKKQLIRYLWIFKDRKLPKLDRRILDLAEDSDEEIQYAAIAALSKNKDNSVRSLCLELIQQQPLSVGNGALTLLIDNYESGDFQIIESVLNISQDINFRHTVGTDLIKLIGAGEYPELHNCSLWVYENTPCSDCRQKIVEVLVNSKQAPQTMLQECLHDCSPEIRSLVS